MLVKNDRMSIHISPQQDSDRKYTFIDMDQNHGKLL